jgi:ribosomal protein L7/L12
MMDHAEMERLRERVERLEAQMEFLHRRLGLSQEGPRRGTRQADGPPAWKPSEAVMDLVRRGDRIAAIKELIRETGASLKDAKEIVDRL